jgi:hypothetical protein
MYVPAVILQSDIDLKLYSELRFSLTGGDGVSPNFRGSRCHDV